LGGGGEKKKKRKTGGGEKQLWAAISEGGTDLLSGGGEALKKPTNSKKKKKPETGRDHRGYVEKLAKKKGNSLEGKPGSFTREKKNVKRPYQIVTETGQ